MLCRNVLWCHFGLFDTALPNLQEFFLGSSGIFSLLQALVGGCLPWSQCPTWQLDSLLQCLIVLIWAFQHSSAPSAAVLSRQQWHI